MVNRRITETLSGLTAGSYSVTVSDTENCIAESSFEIIDDPLEYNIMKKMSFLLVEILYDSGGPDGQYTNNENR